jgi:flagellar hook capping protein FlgD
VPVTSGNVFVSRGTPNPFRSQVDFSFQLPRASEVRVDVYSAAGQRVASLAAGRLDAGPHTLKWNVDQDMPSGVYFYKVRANGIESTGKIVRVD